MLTLSDWFLQRILCKVIRRMFKNKFDADIRIDLKSVNVNYSNDQNDISIYISGSVTMSRDDIEKVINQTI